jgi:hypothetical protein
MAEASFTIRAVDSTRAAFMSVQSSLSRIGRATNQLASITRAAFGATAIAKTFQTMERKLTNIGTLGEEMGFSDEQIASAIKMERAIEGMGNLLMQIPVLLAQVGIKIKDSLVGPTENVEDTIRRFRENLEKTRVSGLRSDIKALGIELENLGRPAGEVADSLLEDAAALRREADAMRSRNTAGALDLERQALQKIIQSRQTGLDVAQRLADAQQDYAEASSRSNAAQRAGLSLEETKLRAFKIERIMGETMESMRRLEKEGKPTGFLAEEYIAKAKEYVTISKQIAKVEEERGRLARDAGDLMAQGFEDAIFAGERLSEVLRQLGLDLMRLIFRNLVTAPLAGGITDIIKGVFGMKADGGVVVGKKPYIVGERGPEVFLSGTSGAIVPNSRLRSEARTGAMMPEQSGAMASSFASFGQSMSGLSSSVSSVAAAITAEQRRPEEPKKDSREFGAIASTFSSFNQSMSGLSSSVSSVAAAVTAKQRRPEEPKKDPREFGAMTSTFASLTDSMSGLASAISSLVGSLDFGASVTDPITSALARADRPGEWSVMRDEISGLRSGNAEDLAQMAQATRPQTQPVQTGTTVNVSYNIQSGVSRAELAPILESERKRLKAEIPDMVRRGGSYRAAFA